MTHELAAETELLTRLAARICAADPALRDHAPWTLHAAVRELLVRVPVYRPYATAGGPRTRTAEETLPDSVVRDAKAAFAVAEEASAVDVVRELALGRLGEGPSGPRSVPGSPRPLPRCAPSRSRTPRSTGTSRWSRRTRWAAIPDSPR